METSLGYIFDNGRLVGVVEWGFGSGVCVAGDPSDFIFGSIDPTRAVAITNAYLVAFFDQYLGGTHEPLLASPSTDYPEVTFAKRP